MQTIEGERAEGRMQTIEDERAGEVLTPALATKFKSRVLVAAVFLVVVLGIVVAVVATDHGSSGSGRINDQPVDGPLQSVPPAPSTTVTSAPPPSTATT